MHYRIITYQFFYVPILSKMKHQVIYGTYEI